MWKKMKKWKKSNKLLSRPENGTVYKTPYREIGMGFFHACNLQNYNVLCHCRVDIVELARGYLRQLYFFIHNQDSKKQFLQTTEKTPF